MTDDGDSLDAASAAQPKDRPTRRGRRLLFKLLVLSASLLLGLLLGEISLRLFFGYAGYRGQAFSRPDPELSWVNKPLADVEVRGRDYSYLVHVNSLGFRGAELRASAGSRILLLGDSYTFGQGVDNNETFPAHLQSLFTSAGRKDVEVVNGGVYGYGARQASGLAHREWDEVKPSVVIFTHCGNDFADDLRFSQGNYKRIRNVVPGRQFLREHSALYHFLARKVVTLFSKLGIHNRNIRFEQPGEGGLVSDMGKKWEESRNLTCGALDGLKKICQERGARFFVTTVGFGWWRGTERPRFSTDAETIREHCLSQGIPFLDPVVAFPSEKKELWFNQSSVGHFSTLGNQLFSKSLFAGLKAAGALTLGK